MLFNYEQRSEIRQVVRQENREARDRDSGGVGSVLYIVMLIAGWLLVIKFLIIPLFEKLQNFCHMWGAY